MNSTHAQSKQEKGLLNIGYCCSLVLGQRRTFFQTNINQSIIPFRAELHTFTALGLMYFSTAWRRLSRVASR
eukprot:m.122718 g.122718  ORF g.122718 m.122718 type:complete len:72 (-) comp12941_c0_seq10:3414-3629(-)